MISDKKSEEMDNTEAKQNCVKFELLACFFYKRRFFKSKSPKVDMKLTMFKSSLIS